MLDQGSKTVEEKKEKESPRKERWGGRVFGRSRAQHMAAKFEWQKCLNGNGDGEKKGSRFGIVGPVNTL